MARSQSGKSYTWLTISSSLKRPSRYMVPADARAPQWARLGELVDPDFLAATTTVVGLGDLESAAEQILAGPVRGRVLVDVTT